MVDQRHVVVTGAGRGLGRSVSIAMAREGWHVWICSEMEEELSRTEAIIREGNGAVTSVCADLGDPSGCDELVEAVLKGTKTLQAVVNNAAVLRRSPVRDITLSNWSRTLAVNLTAPFLISRDLLPLLAQGGSIINVSSQAGVNAFAGESAYCVSKFGIEAFSRCLALELDASPISVNTITPGTKIKPTSVTERDVANVPRNEKEAWVDSILLGPAFVLLASLRGEVSGRRFNAQKLTTAVKSWGARTTLERIDTLHETQ